ncbi:helix-turn-helix domain-containing protein [Ihubacter sp. mB4P-1]|uniref:helix-turn-helix domain-containing protein n=1 Tax=Ihubacter sp. mB4P-1 TaxID=3242370 RepID=UPI0021709B2A|nr:helix-turn-helix domain-containing protein [Emergencia sp.]
MAKKVWDQKKRNELENLLKDGYPISKIGNMLGISYATIYKELRTVLTEEEYRNRQFVKYSAEAGIEHAVAKVMG